MTTRMTNPAMILPDAMTAIQGLYKSIHKAAPQKLLGLVHLRASQVNGCSACVDAAGRSLKKAGESDERMWAAAAWRDAPYFTDAERAALALTEAVTRLADPADPVPDAVWNEFARHFDEPARAAVLLEIALTNFFNRLNITIKEPAGRTWG